ncbi:hypothetical protein GCM10009534_41090 [Kribbella sandramycini]
MRGSSQRCRSARLDWITKHCHKTGRNTFSRRDALRSLHGRARFATAAHLEPAFNLLEDHGYIRAPVTDKPAKGRPSSTYEVHPAVLARQ